MEYKPTIGLEIHAELRTHTKMFCASKNDSEEKRPNVNICPVCMGHPGTLPVINKQAVKHVLSVGLAVGGTIADFTEFDRKNYFYPDIPKGYQLSQYAYPLVTGGELLGVKLTRIHLEEDTARSVHLSTDKTEVQNSPQNDADDTQNDAENYSRIDFNRAGVPLMELVTEPVIHDAETAGNFARELQLLLQYLGAGHANMEKGEMRVEANISVAPDIFASADKRGRNADDRGKHVQRDSADSQRPSAISTLGTKVEIKNLNSFKAVERAIAYEIERQSSLLDRGEEIVQETRGWDEVKQETFSQRAKEDSHDYRYFPDPDLPKLKLSVVDEFNIETLRKDLGELPQEKRARLKREWNIGDDHIDFYIKNKVWADFFEHAAQKLEDASVVTKLSNYIVSDVVGNVGADIVMEKDKVGGLTASSLAETITMIEKDELSSRGAKDLLQVLLRDGGSARAQADTHGLIQKSDSTFITTISKEVIQEHQTVVEEYKNGKESVLQFLVGQVMKKSKGSANPALAKQVLLEEINH